jgi:hypothetical protein
VSQFNVGGAVVVCVVIVLGRQQSRWERRRDWKGWFVLKINALYNMTG